MATNLDILRSLTAYPIPAPVFAGAALRWGVDLKAEATKGIMHDKGFNLCKADVYEWLSTAPNISQGGQSYSFNEDQRKLFIFMAGALREEFGEEKKARYGYKGSRL